MIDNCFLVNCLFWVMIGFMVWAIISHYYLERRWRSYWQTEHDRYYNEISKLTGRTESNQGENM